MTWQHQKKEKHGGGGGEKKQREMSALMPDLWEKLICPNLLVLLYSGERLSASPLSFADVPGFPPHRAAAGAIINYLWGTGENYLLQL